MKEHPWEIEPQVYPFIYGLMRAIQPNQVVETGTFTGKGTISMAKALQDNKKGYLWSIDIKDFGAIKNLEEEKLTEFVELIVEQSPEALEKVMSKNNIDFSIRWVSAFMRRKVRLCPWGFESRNLSMTISLKGFSTLGKQTLVCLLKKKQFMDMTILSLTN